MLNYEVLANIYKSRRNHKLDEWHTFCDWIEGLPLSDSETSNVYHGLSVLNSDITRSLLEMHSKQRNVKGENYENHCR